MVWIETIAYADATGRLRQLGHHIIAVADAWLDVTGGASVDVADTLELNDGARVDLSGGGSVRVGSCTTATDPETLHICADGGLSGSGALERRP